MTTQRIALILRVSSLLSGCDSYQPRQLTHADIASGMPPLTGTLPNGIMADNASR